ncbi:MAG: tetratricopeptide repeat protein, partial [Spirochaetaceae bacterium]|nr:tetratricopeptide repeat protein [Spirochaetaceae bacterium]
DRTQSASEYTLGRIAFARGDYTLALRYFDRILQKDRKNVTALRAAAYTLIRLERFTDAEAYYGRLLELVPESADSGYSYAVVLMAIKEPARAEEVLNGYAEMLAGNREAELLLARARRDQGKVEAIEDYRRYLAAGDDSRVRLEYAGVLEAGEFYARALEEYRLLLQEAAAGSSRAGVSAAELRYAVGRLLLIADNAEEGIAEIEGAVADGFTGDGEMEALLQSGRVPPAHRESLRRIIEEVASAKQP